MRGRATMIAAFVEALQLNGARVRNLVFDRTEDELNSIAA
jgi:hypothetical protein